MGNIDRVVQFIQQASWGEFPEPVLQKARMCAVDNLAAMISGTRARISSLTAEYAEQSWPGGESTIICTRSKISAPGAAFANGYAANALDIDDCGLYTKGHPGAVVFPTALAVVEECDLGGQELLEAMVVGYEIAFRVARCWHDYHDIYQAGGSWGSVASTAVTSHLLGLDEKQIRHALGIAEYHAPPIPIMRDVDRPAMVKHGIGFGAMNGIISAQLAAEGFTAVPSILSFDQYEQWVSDIENHYLLPEGICWKEYACCAWAHPALDAVSDLLERHQVNPSDISRINVEICHEGVRLGSDLPNTTEQAQFNIAWPLAALIVDGEMGPDQILEDRLKDQEIQDMARKVELQESQELNRLYQLAIRGKPEGKLAAKVRISTTDGNVIESGVVEGNIRYPQPGWDQRRLEEKFRWLVAPLMNIADLERLLDLMWHLDEVSEIGELLDLIMGPLG